MKINPGIDLSHDLHKRDVKSADVQKYEKINNGEKEEIKKIKAGAYSLEISKEGKEMMLNDENAAHIVKSIIKDAGNVLVYASNGLTEESLELVAN